MKVYIAWSGKISKEVASILNSWLPLMNPHIETFFSAEDIPTGIFWHDALRREIVTCDCALLCLTSDNIHSPWIYYEAGIIRGKTEPGYVIPVLFDVSIAQLDGPFTHSQAVTLDKDGLRKMAAFLNHLCGRKAGSNTISECELYTKFEELYPTLEGLLTEVRNSQKERFQGNQSEQSTEDLKRNFATVNSKLDAILSRLSKAHPGDSYPRQENTL